MIHYSVSTECLPCLDRKFTVCKRRIGYAIFFQDENFVARLHGIVDGVFTKDGTQLRIQCSVM